MDEWDIAIETVVGEMDAPFDTHKVIQQVARRNQRKYVAALAAINTDTPFHKLHTALGRRIKVVCKRLGFTDKGSRSPDMFGQNSKCLHWSRRHPQ